MKRNFKLAAFAIAAMFAMASCENEESQTNVQNVQDEAMESLIYELDAINESTMAMYAGNAAKFATRGTPLEEFSLDDYPPEIQLEFRGWWRRFLAVLTADAVGAACGTAAGGPIGGAAVGIAASIIMVKQTNRYTVEDGSPLSAKDNLELMHIVMDDANFPMNNGVSSYDKIGDCHNKIILEMLDDEETYFNADGSLKDRAVFDKIILGVAEEFDGNTVNLTFIRRNIAELTSAEILSQEATIDSQINNYVKLYPNKEAEATIIRSYITTAAELPSAEAIKAYSLNVENAIDRAVISDQDKAVLLSGVSVAKNSVTGWKLAVPEYVKINADRDSIE